MQTENNAILIKKISLENFKTISALVNVILKASDFDTVRWVK